MTTKDEALRLALEALEWIASKRTGGLIQYKAMEPITACREALAQPAGEPPTSRGADRYFYEAGYNAGKRAAMLSSDAQPSEWVGLSDDEISDATKGIRGIHCGIVDEIARAIEAKLREKNAGKPKEEL